MNKRKSENVVCAFCGESFERLLMGGTTHKRGCGVRASNVKTCSPKCSKGLRDKKR